MLVAINLGMPLGFDYYNLLQVRNQTNSSTNSFELKLFLVTAHVKFIYKIFFFHFVMTIEFSMNYELRLHN